MTEDIKKRGRPPKLETGDINTTAIMTLEQALRNGAVIEMSKMDMLIKQEIERTKKEMRKEISIEYSKKLSDQKNRLNDVQINDYLRKSGLTDKEFVKQLIHLNVSADDATLLRDEHFMYKDKKGNLDRIQIWQLIRSEEVRRK